MATQPSGGLFGYYRSQNGPNLGDLFANVLQTRQAQQAAYEGFGGNDNKWSGPLASIVTALVGGLAGGYGQSQEQEGFNSALGGLADALGSERLKRLKDNPLVGYFADDIASGDIANQDYRTKLENQAQVQGGYSVGEDGSWNLNDGVIDTLRQRNAAEYVPRPGKMMMGDKEATYVYDPLSGESDILGVGAKWNPLQGGTAGGGSRGKGRAVTFAPNMLKGYDEQAQEGANTYAPNMLKGYDEQAQEEDPDYIPSDEEELERRVQELMQLGLPGGAAGSQAGNMFSTSRADVKNVDKATSEILNRTAAQEDEVAKLRKALASGLTTGGPGGWIENKADWVQSFWDDDAEARLTARQLLTSTQGPLARAQRVAGEGAMSNADQALLAQAAPSLANTPEANKILTDILEATSKRERARAELWNKFRVKTGSSDTAKYKELDREFIDSNNLFEPDEKGGLKVRKNLQSVDEFLDSKISYKGKRKKEEAKKQRLQELRQKYNDTTGNK